jgi:hypothetical protein
MKNFYRRSCLQASGTTLLGLVMVKLGLGDDVTELRDGDLTKWMSRLNGQAIQLADGQISPLRWQEAMDEIFGSAPMASLKEKLKFDQLSKAILEKMPADRGEFFHSIDLSTSQLLDDEGKKEPNRKLIAKIARVNKGCSIPPHGHSNMVSAFLCLSGEFDVRLYDRLDNRPGEMVLRTSMEDVAAGPGTWSSVSDYRDNVHWLTAMTDDCFLLTTKLIMLEPDLPLHGRINVDVRRAKQVGNDTMIAQKISWQEARELYRG